MSSAPPPNLLSNAVNLLNLSAIKFLNTIYRQGPKALWGKCNMKFRILVMINVVLVAMALGLGCSKGGKKDKPAAAKPEPATSPVVAAPQKIISPERAAELSKQLDEASDVLKKLSTGK